MGQQGSASGTSAGGGIGRFLTRAQAPRRPLEPSSGFQEGAGRVRQAGMAGSASNENGAARQSKRLLIVLMIAAAAGACEPNSAPPSRSGPTESAAEGRGGSEHKASSGRGEVEFEQGWRYHTGTGVPKDPPKAIGWYERAAAQGSVMAQHNLGLIYSRGEGVPKDAAKAFEWFEKAAAQGDAASQTTLGWMYTNGEGVPKSVIEAAYWYQKAAAQGDATAQHNLAVAYAQGSGVPKSGAKAAEWYEKAAAQGHADSQVQLGLLYTKGDGVAKDWVLAYAWFNLAASQGSDEARRFRDDLPAASMHWDGSGDLPDVIPEKNLVRDPLTGNYYELTKNEMKAFLPRPITPESRAEAERLSGAWKPGEVLRRESESSPVNVGRTTGTRTLVKVSTGTAFLVDSDGHAITSNHVVGSCTEIRIQGQMTAASIVSRDQVSDLALLKVSSPVADTAILAADPTKLRQGDDIVVFGFPLDSLLSAGGNLTPGVVSALTGLGNNTNQVQITAPIQPGSSGSPVLDARGHVVAVVTMKLSDSTMVKRTGSVPQNVNFAVGGQTLKAFLDSQRVRYRTGGSLLSRTKSLADIGDEARRWTTVVECWK